MKVLPHIVTAFEITDVPTLDSIRVFMKDYGDGRGRLTIECFGQSWSNYWGAMGVPLREFLLLADVNYIESALNRSIPYTPKKYQREYLQRIITALKEALQEEISQ